MAQLVKKIRITATIELLTGLHIGGSKESVEIGGIDLPVIKLATKDNQPYIPGSSLKGKMRCLLEQSYGISKHGDVGKDKGTIRSLFGFSKGTEKAQPSRLIVRDARLTPEAESKLKNCEYLDMPFTENKFENTIDRLKGIAGNPRQSERVPAGAEFDAEFIINVWDEEGSEKQSVDTFKEGIALLENDYLGGSGSRGYGQIVFKNWKALQFNGPDWAIGKAYELGEI